METLNAARTVLHLGLATLLAIAWIGPAVASDVAPAAGATAPPGAGLHLIPRPEIVHVMPHCTGAAPAMVLSAKAGLEAVSRHNSGVELLVERWNALGIGSAALHSGRFEIRLSRPSPNESTLLKPQGYVLSVHADRITIFSRDDDGVFYAFVTLSQLAQRGRGGWTLPCVHIEDEPALRWRILSDDISRGPLPNMRYFKERIRTIASFKMNGYAPYVEHVVLDPVEPLPAPLDGLTVVELRELDAYAKRFHVALIPQQQTFAHMHNTLRWEQYAPLAETPHGYLLSPANAGGVAYAQELIRNQLAAVPAPPFFHIGADEPVDLGRGQTRTLVQQDGEGAVYTQFVTAMAGFVASKGIRPMIWDDALSRHPELFSTLPKSLVFVNWHYGDEKTFVPYIKRIADGGFEQMVAPGSRNWNEIYPDLDAALANIERFTSEGKDAGVLGLFQTVWHDDGETLFEATWFPVIYAAAGAWERGAVERERFTDDFPSAFFGVDDRRYGDDLRALARARTLLRAGAVSEASNYLFWADPFDARFSARTAGLNLAGVRSQAEVAIAHLRLAVPPLHPNAAGVMHLAARRYDQLARNLQIAREARDLYGDAAAQLKGGRDSLVERDLFLTKYLFWEQRDALMELRPLVESAWEYENRPSHERSVLLRYDAAAQRALVRADAVNRAVYEFYEPSKKLPSFDTLLAPTLASPP